MKSLKLRSDKLNHKLSRSYAASKCCITYDKGSNINDSSGFCFNWVFSCKICPYIKTAREVVPSKSARWTFDLPTYVVSTEGYHQSLSASRLWRMAEARQWAFKHMSWRSEPASSEPSSFSTNYSILWASSTNYSRLQKVVSCIILQEFG